MVRLVGTRLCRHFWAVAATLLSLPSFCRLALETELAGGCHVKSISLSINERNRKPQDLGARELTARICSTLAAETLKRVL
jgi:hypothetical protein